MPRKAKEKTPGQIKTIKPRCTDKPTLVPVGGVAGMYLQITPSGAKSWAVRLTVSGKRRWMGLGSYPEISMAEAREAARDAKALARKGVDPVEKRQQERQEATFDNLALASFSQVVNEFIPIKQQGLSPGKHRDDWGKQLQKYTFERIGAKPIEEITRYDIGEILEPLQGRLKNETVGKIRQSLKEVFAYARAKGYYKDENPAEKKTVSLLIGKEPVEQKAENFPSLQLDDLGRFWAALQKRDGMSAEAVKFQLMTATRPGAIRFATWDEFDLRAKLWTVQPGRKSAKVYGDAKRVALTWEMVRLLDALPRLSGSPYVFWAPQGGALSDATLSAVMKKMHAADVKAGGRGFVDIRTGEPAVPHGNRSTFRVWAQERTEYDPNLAEAALWHTLGSKVERAYARSDMIERRRAVMQSWVRFIDDSARIYAKNLMIEKSNALLDK
jgi:integrase